MNIYLSGAISAGRDKIQTYIRIKELIEESGHILTSPQTADPKVTDSGEGEPEDVRDIFDRDIQQLNESDFMIAEVSIPSLGVGYEIAYAIQREMPILCLYDLDHCPRRVSAMIAGNTYPKLKLMGYTVESLSDIILDELKPDLNQPGISQDPSFL